MFKKSKDSDLSGPEEDTSLGSKYSGQKRVRAIVKIMGYVHTVQYSHPVTYDRIESLTRLCQPQHVKNEESALQTHDKDY